MNINTGLEEFSSLFGEKRVKGTLKKMADIEINHCLLNIKKIRKGLEKIPKR